MSTAQTKQPLKTSITKDEINKLPLQSYNGPVTVIHTDEELKKILPSLHKAGILGFDTESRPAFKKGESYGISLVQLAAAETIYLIQIDQLKTPTAIKKIFTDPNLLKVGVGLSNDTQMLKDIFEFEAQGFLDLGTITDQAGITNNGLRGLTALLLGFRISKSQQCTNWARKKLTEKQIKYAATDAWVSREIYLALEAYGLVKIESNTGTKAEDAA